MHAWESSALVELTGLLLLAARALGARCVRHARESERANARVSKVREILIGTYWRRVQYSTSLQGGHAKSKKTKLERTGGCVLYAG